MKNFPKITFGIIVLNGEPFTRYCLRSLYMFAHEIIVVEGGHEDAKVVCTPDGHSIDGTLETLRRFKEEEDPENKVQIVTRDGFWKKRDELGRDRTLQSRAYADRATGDYLWQVDIDEFYRPEDMQSILTLLRDDSTITTLSFWVHTFWGSLEYVVDGWKRRRGDEFNRVFKWGPGYRYVTHEPPTVCDERCQDLRTMNWITGKEFSHRGIYLYHYAHLFPHQVLQKAQIYKDEKPELCSDILEWAQKNYMCLKDPYHVERHYWMPSWLERFGGDHPPEANRLMSDILSGHISEELRFTDDIERLMKSKKYWMGRQWYKVFDYGDRFGMWVNLQINRTKHCGRILLDKFLPKKYRKYG